MEMEETTLSPAEKVKKWLKILSVSRILRWTLIFMSLWWLFTNAHNDLPPEAIDSKYTNADSRFIEVGGIMAHCQMTGQGQPIILLHDAQSSLLTWSVWAKSLSDKYRVICVDLPGFGLTGPHPRGSYSAFMYVDFLDSLSEKLELNKFSLAGNGLGAQIAWQFAAEKPGKIDKLILLAPTGFEEKSKSLVNLMASTPVLNRVLWTITPRSIIRIFLEEVYADDSLVTDSLVNTHFELFLRTGNRKAFTDRASVRDNRPPVLELIKKITAPTLILWGAEDSRISPEFAYEFHQRMKTSDLRIYPNTGHWPQEENPLKTSADVRDFLEGRF